MQNTYTIHSFQKVNALNLPITQLNYAILILALFHITIISLSNYLVQIPVKIFIVHTTWGAFSFPLIFLATDLTARLLGKGPARLVIAKVMLPALIISYIFSSMFMQGKFQGFSSFLDFNSMVVRITCASFSAYVIGQLLDIQVFDRMRQSKYWWLAPSSAAIIGGAIDTLIFFSIAFWRSEDVFMAQNWIEIGAVDYCIKLFTLLIFMLPTYGAVLNLIVRELNKPKFRQFFN